MADQYGYQAGQTDEYGNPIPPTGGTTGGYGTTTGVYDTGMGTTGTTTGASCDTVTGTTGTTGAGLGHQHGISGKLHRSGSSSSSSSEDDGHGGRRKKKGLKDKIKEKLPGVGGGGHKQHTDDTATTSPGTGGYGYSGGEHHEKKGMMDKIKEKLPGQH